MSDIKFEILYQSKTIIVILNFKENEKDLFNKFIEQIKKELDIKDINNKKEIFKIMTLNTKEMYLIVNEDNFDNIIKEKTKDGIIKLFLDIDFVDEIEQINNKNEIKKIEEDDFNEEISLSNFNEKNIINEKEKIENKIINEKIDNINLENSNNFNIINDVKEKDNNNIIMKENQNIIEDNTIINPNININNSKKELKENKLNNNPIIIENYINDNKINQINTNNLSNIIQKEILELCTICKKLIKDKIKYECCICDKCILCPNCEKNHQHPCIKFKKGKNFLKSLKDCHFFMSQKQNFNSLLPIKLIKNIFNITYDIIVQLEIDNHIEFGTNTLIEIPFKIKNFSDFPINSEDFIIISRNYSIVNIIYDVKDKFIIPPKNFINKKLLCQSYDKTGREIINVEIYSNKIKIRENANVKENMEITISNDEENKDLNKKFIFYPKIQLLNKLRKKMLLYILENHFVEKSVTKIYESLKNNKWDLDKALNELKNLDM